MKMGQFVKRGWPAKVIGFLAWSFVFAVIYGQSPLYTSNQNSKFLHGLARAGFGYLNNDWLANTIDPLPIFSGLVFITIRVFQTGTPFYLYYALIMGVYFIAILGIMDIIFDISRERIHKLVFLTLFLILHSAALRFLLSNVAGVADPFLLEGGVAGQRILGQVLQPSTFGVFLVLSIYLFLRRQPYLSLVSLAVAIYFHSVYLLPGALLVLAYMWTAYREQRCVSHTLTLGVMSLILVSPILIYTNSIFLPSSGHVTSQVNEILVYFRNPHHANVSEWMGWKTAISVSIVMVALLIVRRTRLFPIISIVALVSVLLTTIQVITESNWLALIYPWRASVVLVPLSSSVILAYIVKEFFDISRVRSWKFARWTGLITFIILTGLIIVGIARFQIETARRQDDNSRPMMEYVSDHKSPADTYLVPTEMESFRLTTGAPIFVNFKSVPYQDTDVLEWYDRVSKARFFYRDRVEGVDCDLLSLFQEVYAVTHVVLDEDLLLLSCSQLGLEVYRDEHYAVFRIEVE